MKPPPFAYHRPETVAAALDALATLDEPKLLAGGQSLMPMLNFRALAPANLIDLNRVSGLDGISIGDGGVRIGAMTRQRTVDHDAELARVCPLLRQALHHVGHIQTRNRGTVGGSLSHLDPSAELPGVFLALDADLTVAKAAGSRTVAMADWSRGLMEPALDEDELLTEIRFAPWPAGHGSAFVEFARRHGDFALAGVGVLLTLDGAGMIDRVALVACGVAPGPVRLRDAEAVLVGAAPSEEAFKAARAAAETVPGLDDIHAPASYRKRLTGVLVERALREALGRAEVTR